MRVGVREDVRMIVELGPGESARAFDAMRALRGDLEDRGRFARYVDDVLRPRGYRLAGVVEGEGSDAASVAGFRAADSLAWGSHLYVDDLSTHPSARRRGHAGRLLEWLAAEARRLGCRAVHLDSGVGADRADAHRLYLGSGYRISAHHFVVDLGPVAR